MCFFFPGHICWESLRPFLTNIKEQHWSMLAKKLPKLWSGFNKWSQHKTVSLYLTQVIVYNPKETFFNHLVPLLIFQDSSRYFLATSWAWFPNRRHSGAATLWKLSAIPGWPLCRRYLSTLQLPWSSWWPVWQVWATHQCCGPQGECGRAACTCHIIVEGITIDDYRENCGGRKFLTTHT